MKALRVTIIIIAISVASILILGALFPSQHHVEQRVVIDAQPREIFKQINTLKNWENWTPTSPDISYSGPESGVGATQTWVDRNGKGYLKITKSNPYTLLQAEMKFPGNKTFETNWMLRPDNDSTIVIWGMEFGDLSYPLGRLQGLITNGRMQANIHRGLNNLKTYMEEGEVASRNQDERR